MHESARDSRPLRLTSGHLARPPIRLGADTQTLDQLSDTSPTFASTDSVDLKR